MITTVTGKNGYWITQHEHLHEGVEYNLVLIAVAVGVALVGPGTPTLHC